MVSRPFLTWKTLVQLRLWGEDSVRPASLDSSCDRGITRVLDTFFIWQRSLSSTGHALGGSSMQIYDYLIREPQAECRTCERIANAAVTHHGKDKIRLRVAGSCWRATKHYYIWRIADRLFLSRLTSRKPGAHIARAKTARSTRSTRSLNTKPAR